MPLHTIPFTLPDVHTPKPGVTSSSTDVNTGGYDIMLGGHGFRLATDQQHSYQRLTEQSTTHRFDSSLEPGEQTLSPLPWIKAQSSFHGGAGQLDLEQGFTAFQYQQEQVEHARFDTSLGIDCWTPGQIRRLPDCHYTGFAHSSTQMVTATDGSHDYAIVGGVNSLFQVNWASGPDSTPTPTAIDLSPAAFGGASNCTVVSLATDGTNYYALITLAAAVGGQSSYIVSGSCASIVAPTILYQASTVLKGVIAWSKSRLMGALGASVYELSTSASSAALPTPKYTYPVVACTYTAISESPNGVLVAALVGGQSSILELTLDTSGNTPTLGGGTSVAVLPPGEIIKSLAFYLGSFLAIGSTSGVRIATFDTYTGALKQGPLSVTTTQPVLALAGRDRFIHAGYTNQQADGHTGLVTLDLSYVVDAAGRNAYNPGLRPPTAAPTGLGAVTGIGVLHLSNRLLFVTAEGLFVEGNGPGSDGDAWLRTSRIRYDTAESKLFTVGRIEGTLDVAEIAVTGIVPFQPDTALGTYGFISTGNPGPFGLLSGLHEWIQMKFDLIGSSCIMNSYQVKALPAPQRQNLIILTVNCFLHETDRDGVDVTDPELPRTRYMNVKALEANGDQVRYVEFTNMGPVAQQVAIDQILFESYSRPTVDDDFGGYITFKLREVG